MDRSREVIAAIEQARNTLPDDQRDKPWGQLLYRLSPHLIYYGQKLRDFFVASERIDTLNKLSAQVADELKDGRNLLLKALHTQKNQCSWYKWWEEPIDKVIANVEKLSEKSVKEALQTIGARVDEAKTAVAQEVLHNSTTVLAITTIINTVQVICTYIELKEASNLVEISRKRLAPGGIVAKWIDETQQHMTQAAEFLKRGLLDEADSRLIRAGESAQLAYTELNGIQIRCEDRVKTLKTGQFMSISSSISTCFMSILQVATILTNTTAGVGTALLVSSWVFAGAGFVISGLSTNAYFIAGKRIDELQCLMEEIDKKMVEWNKLRSSINELRNLIELKRLEARRS